MARPTSRMKEIMLITTTSESDLRIDGQLPKFKDTSIIKGQGSTYENNMRYVTNHFFKMLNAKRRVYMSEKKVSSDHPEEGYTK